MNGQNSRTKPVRSGWFRAVRRLGVAALLGIAFSAAVAQAAPFAYVPINNVPSSPPGPNDQVAVIDTATNTIVATVEVGLVPWGVAVTPDGAFVYVTNSLDNTVSVIDTATNTVTATVPVGGQPRGVAVTPDGAFAYVANGAGCRNAPAPPSCTVSVIDTATHTVTTNVVVGLEPTGVAVTPDSAFVYVTNEASGTVSVIATATHTVTATAPVGRSPVGVAVAPDGASAWVANAGSDNVSVIDTATHTVTGGVLLGGAAGGLAVTPDGAFVYVTTKPFSTAPFVSVIDTATHTVTATVPVGSLTSDPLGVAVTPDGASVYVADFGGTEVSVIDTATNTVTATVAVEGSPRGFGQFIGPSPRVESGTECARGVICHVDLSRIHPKGPRVIATGSIARGPCPPRDNCLEFQGQDGIAITGSLWGVPSRAVVSVRLAVVNAAGLPAGTPILVCGKANRAGRLSCSGFVPDAFPRLGGEVDVFVKR